MSLLPCDDGDANIGKPCARAKVTIVSFPHYLEGQASWWLFVALVEDGYGVTFVRFFIAILSEFRHQ